MEDQETLNEKLQYKEEPEENPENMINTEENVVVSNNPPSTTPISSKEYNPPPPKPTTTTNNNTDPHLLWYDLSIISWFLFLCTGLNIFIGSKNEISLLEYAVPIPVKANFSFVIGFISAIGTIGLILYFNKTSLNKSNSIESGMLGDMSKFHFVPLLLVSLLFITLTEPTTKASYVFSLLLSLLSCGSLVFIYLKIDYEGEWYEIITIKKGVFSSLIALTFYTFFFSISSIGYRSDPSEGFINGCGIVFSLLIGIGNIGFGFYFKDLLVLITNALLYLEMAKYYFYIKNGADGAIDITMVLITIGVICYLLFKERENVYKCSQ